MPIFGHIATLTKIAGRPTCNSANPRAALTANSESGVTNSQDFFDFLAAFFGGC